MATVTKKELIDRIAEATGQKRIDVKATVQGFLDQIILELGKGNRLEFRDFGVFEVKQRRARQARNPKTNQEVMVPPKQTVKFKPGRLMRDSLGTDQQAADLLTAAFGAVPPAPPPSSASSTAPPTSPSIKPDEG